MLRRLACAAAAVALTGLCVPPAAAADCTDPSMPCLTITPGSGTVGTRFTISGRITQELDTWRGYFHGADGARLFAFGHGIAGTPEQCELNLDLQQEHTELDADGDVTGSFVVGSTTGICRMMGLGPMPAGPGTYNVSLGCYACGVASFRLTGLPVTGRPVVPVAAAGLAALLLGSALLWLGHGNGPRHRSPAQQPERGP